ncbi:hypothetical protein NPIL_290781 [Nephila pilipes]|uniref:Uncharacterized protein n=1 Tax=Nephila pilipes TaxID=299642 RepID=A0A8X6MWU6_NEPPI|nr:hypothetical protein NPIL_290781 [Nephila pilipes]
MTVYISVLMPPVAKMCCEWLEKHEEELSSYSSDLDYCANLRRFLCPSWAIRLRKVSLDTTGCLEGGKSHRISAIALPSRSFAFLEPPQPLRQFNHYLNLIFESERH